MRLDFLDKGAKYECTLYADAKGADYKTNPKAYTIKKEKVKRGDVLNLKMAPGGGFAISLEARWKGKEGVERVEGKRIESERIESERVPIR